LSVPLDTVTPPDRVRRSSHMNGQSGPRSTVLEPAESHEFITKLVFVFSLDINRRHYFNSPRRRAWTMKRERAGGLPSP
jgi:hypothetical protein